LTSEIERVAAAGCVRGADLWRLAWALFASPQPGELSHSADRHACEPQRPCQAKPHPSSPELAVERVRSRIRAGGHPIDEAVVVRRFWKGLKNLVALYLALADKWSVFDNSKTLPKKVAEGSLGAEPLVYEEDVWTGILKAAR